MLLKRLEILESDYEHEIQREFSYHLRFLIKELPEFFLTKQKIELVNFILILKVRNYLNEKDVILNVQMIISIIMNFDKICDVFGCTDFCEKIIKIVESNEDINFTIDIFYEIIKYCLSKLDRGEKVMEKIIDIIIICLNV